MVLAIALNFEPTRLGIVALLMIRPHPIRQLLGLLAGSFLTSAIAGVIVLLLAHHGAPALLRFDGAKIQIAVGIGVLILAALLAADIPGKLLGGRGSNGNARSAAASEDETPIQHQLVGWLSRHLKGFASGSSPWFAAALGVGIAIPSVDYLALLMIIATSGGPIGLQIAALLTFLTVANVVLLIPITSYLLVPEKTKGALERLRRWILARRRRDFAILLTIAGCLMIALGVKGL